MNKTPLIVTAVAALGFSAVAALAYSPAPVNGQATTLSSASAAPAGVVLAQNSDQSAGSDNSGGGTDQSAPSTQGDDQK
jgi:hypothetical protein